jgi:hypothetical protein
VAPFFLFSIVRTLVTRRSMAGQRGPDHGADVSALHHSHGDGPEDHRPLDARADRGRLPGGYGQDQQLLSLAEYYERYS